MTRTDPWPVDRTHAAPSVPPPAPKPADARLADLLSEYADTRSRRVRARQHFTDRPLGDIACEIHDAELAAGVGRDQAEGQSLGELVARPEFPALVLQVRALGARNAYAMHSLSAPERTRSVLAS